MTSITSILINNKKVKIVEWPGKALNDKLEATLDDDQIKKLTKKPSYFKISTKLSELHIAPWGTKLIVKSKGKKNHLTMYISHAMFEKESWQIMPLREIDEDGFWDTDSPTTFKTLKDDLENRGIIEYRY